MLDAGNCLSAALYQLNAIMPFPPKLYESISPDSSRKEDRLLSKLQQFTMDSLGVLIYLQEQLKGVQLTPRRLALQYRPPSVYWGMRQHISTRSAARVP